MFYANIRETFTPAGGSLAPNETVANSVGGFSVKNIATTNNNVTITKGLNDSGELMYSLNMGNGTVHITLPDGSSLPNFALSLHSIQSSVIINDNIIINKNWLNKEHW